MLTADKIKQIAINNLPEDWTKLSAKTQRDLFGFASFGQKDIKVYPGFGIHTRKKTAFGSSYKVCHYPWESVAEMINNKKIEGN